MGEIVQASDLEFVELDGRRSGKVYYQLICHLGSGVLALIAYEGSDTRAVPVSSDRGNEAMAHPETPAFLGRSDVIYGGHYEELIVEYRGDNEDDTL